MPPSRIAAGYWRLEATATNHVKFELLSSFSCKSVHGNSSSSSSRPSGTWLAPSPDLVESKEESIRAIASASGSDAGWDLLGSEGKRENRRPSEGDPWPLHQIGLFYSGRVRWRIVSQLLRLKRIDERVSTKRGSRNHLKEYCIDRKTGRRLKAALTPSEESSLFHVKPKSVLTLRVPCETRIP